MLEALGGSFPSSDEARFSLRTDCRVMLRGRGRDSTWGAQPRLAAVHKPPIPPSSLTNANSSSPPSSTLFGEPHLCYYCLGLRHHNLLTRFCPQGTLISASSPSKSLIPRPTGNSPKLKLYKTLRFSTRFHLTPPLPELLSSGHRS